MSQLQIQYQTGSTVYFLVRSRSSTIYSSSGPGGLGTYATLVYTTYAVAATEQGTASGYYVATFPSVLAAGVYSIVAKRQAGGSPAESDLTIGSGDFQWDGSNTLPLSDLVTSGQYARNNPGRLTRAWAVSGFLVQLKSSTDHATDFVSGVVSGQVSRDGASFGALQSGAFTEVGMGFYKVNLTSGDLNADTIGLRFTAAGISGGQSDPLSYVLLTQRTSG